MHFWRSVGTSDDNPDFDATLRHFLMTHDYPGNVRDLRRIVMAMHSCHACGGAVSIGALPETERPLVPLMDTVDHVPSQVSSSDPWDNPGFVSAIEAAIARGVDLREIGRAASSAAIRIALEQEDGNLQRAARRLGVTDRALQMRRANGEAMAA